MIILAMLIGFIALISAINALFATIFGLSSSRSSLRLLSPWRG
ncbi:Nucleoside permease NupC [Klebsiella michiganensis]|uniref:Nucleoside permease NupC n=1 Tax=Klebsiella michiganensis TaxID=1134687 RepID=A0A7H4LVA6_9ENTR|nr:Nucleoside permease NupC [Klebsiella michiganensis]